MAKSASMRVFEIACATLAVELTPHRFVYRKSHRELRREGRLFEHLVTFSTSRSINSIPGHIHLEVRATAWSEELALYRKQAGIKLPVNEAVLFSTTLENIFRPAPPYVRYDIGDEETRDATLARIAVVLRTEALRAFELVESPLHLKKAVEAGEMPGIDEEGVRDCFAWFDATEEPGR